MGNLDGCFDHNYHFAGFQEHNSHAVRVSTVSDKRVTESSKIRFASGCIYRTKEPSLLFLRTGPVSASSRNLDDATRNMRSCSTIFLHAPSNLGIVEEGIIHAQAAMDVG